MYMRNVIVEDVEIHPYPSIPPFCVEQPIIAHFFYFDDMTSVTLAETKVHET